MDRVEIWYHVHYSFQYAADGAIEHGVEIISGTDPLIEARFRQLKRALSEPNVGREFLRQQGHGNNGVFLAVDLIVKYSRITTTETVTLDTIVKV
jgi:hypothetical protein